MNNLKLILFFIFLIYSTLTSANSKLIEADSLFTLANNLFKEGNYQEAIEEYNIIQNNYKSAELFYNLGNAHFKTFKFGLARYYYEKALQISPYDAEINHNVNLLLERLPYDIGFGLPSEVEKFKYVILNSNAKLYLLVLSFLFLNCAFFLWYINIFKNIRYFYSMFVLLFLLNIFLLGLIYWIDANRNEQYIIVVKGETFIKNEPIDSASDLFVLNEAVKAIILDEFGDFFKIKLPDGKLGWGKKTDFLAL